MNKIGIIGCGIGGLATAIRLQLKQKRVTVFESNSYPGGKLSEINSGNFRFDAGPSLFTLPKHVTDLFELAGKNPNDYFQYSKLKEICTKQFSKVLELLKTGEAIVELGT